MDIKIIEYQEKWEKYYFDQGAPYLSRGIKLGGGGNLSTLFSET